MGLPERNKRLLLPTIRVVFHKMKSNVWFPKPKHTRPKMMPTVTVLNPRTVLKTTVTPLRDPSVAMKSKPRWTLRTRLPSKSKIDETISWLDANPAAEKEEYEEKQKELEGIAMPILQKMGGGGAGGMPAGMPDMGGIPGGGAAGAPAGDDPAGGPTIEEID